MDPVLNAQRRARKIVDSILRDNLTRYVSYLALASREKLDSQARVVSQASDILASFQCLHYSTGLFKHILQRTVSEPLAPKEAQ